jgi:hypothetical protein
MAGVACLGYHNKIGNVLNCTSARFEALDNWQHSNGSQTGSQGRCTRQGCRDRVKGKVITEYLDLHGGLHGAMQSYGGSSKHDHAHRLESSRSWEQAYL